jgi:RNA-directed DNA polymerase
MVYNSFATRKGKWLHQWLHYVVKKLKTEKNIQNLYFLKIDISKYFYSIDHSLLKEKISKHIHQKDLIYSIESVINGYQTSSIFDNLFDSQSHYQQTKEKGVPIGALYSQLFANFFLSEIDWYIVQELKPKVYARYMDDFLLIDTKENLLSWQFYIIQKLKDHHLTVIPRKVQINTISHGIPFLGFKIIENNWKVKVFVNGKNKRKFWKTLDKVQEYITKSENTYYTREEQQRILSVVESRKWLFKHTDVYENIFKNLPENLQK